MLVLHEDVLALEPQRRLALRDQLALVVLLKLVDLVACFCWNFNSFFSLFFCRLVLLL